MLSRALECLSELYPLDWDLICKEIDIGSDYENYPYFLLLLFIIEISILKLNGYRFKPTGDWLQSLFLNKLNEKPNQITDEPSEDTPENEFDNNQSYARQALELSKYFLYMCILAPISEEFIFRGILTPALKNGMSSLGFDQSSAPIISSVIFGMIHPFPKKLPMIYFGLLLENINEYNPGKLWSSTRIHMKHNFISVSPLLLATIGSMTVSSIEYIWKQKSKLKNKLSINTDLPSKLTLGAIEGGELAMFAIPTTALVHDYCSQLLPQMLSEIPLSNKIVGTVSIGITIGAVNAGLTFFSERKKISPKKPVNDNSAIRNVSGP